MAGVLSVFAELEIRQFAPLSCMMWHAKTQAEIEITIKISIKSTFCGINLCHLFWFAPVLLGHHPRIGNPAADLES